MQIRPAQASDLDQLDEIDGAIESARYLHVDRTGNGLGAAWKLEERPLRAKLIERNAIPDDERFIIKQLLTGVEEGVVVVGEHEEQVVAIAAAVQEPSGKTLRLVDLRVDFDLRREGLGSAMLYQLIQAAREAELRAVSARTLTGNFPAAMFLSKVSFELAGLDTHLQSNHDLVKESVSLFWYLPLD